MTWPGSHSEPTALLASVVVSFTPIISFHHFPARLPLPLWGFLGAVAAGVTCRLLCTWQSHSCRRCSQRVQGQGLWPRKVEQDLAALLRRCVHSFSPRWRVCCQHVIPSSTRLEGTLFMWQKYMFLSLSLEMLFKAGELDENPNRVSISGEQETLEYSESA